MSDRRQGNMFLEKGWIKLRMLDTSDKQSSGFEEEPRGGRRKAFSRGQGQSVVDRPRVTLHVALLPPGQGSSKPVLMAIHMARAPVDRGALTPGVNGGKNIELGLRRGQEHVTKGLRQGREAITSNLDSRVKSKGGVPFLSEPLRQHHTREQAYQFTSVSTLVLQPSRSLASSTSRCLPHVVTSWIAAVPTLSE